MGVMTVGEGWGGGGGQSGEVMVDGRGGGVGGVGKESRGVAYCFRGEERLSGERKEAWGPVHPRIEHVWSLGQSLDVHHPLWKLRHTS